MLVYWLSESTASAVVDFAFEGFASMGAVVSFKQSEA